jgi:hypothetical protein
MQRPICVMDTECARNFWLMKIRDIQTRKVIASFSLCEGSPPLDTRAMINIMSQITMVTFNGNHYDIPMVLLALTGATCQELKEANDRIIPGSGLSGLKAWDFLKYYGLQMPNWLDHIDLMEVVPGVRISLKTYMGCINSRKMQDLPFVPDALLSPVDRIVTSIYCENDLEGTDDLYHAVIARIKLREAINAKYNAVTQIGYKDSYVYDHWETQQYVKGPIDVRSKSDAQIAETLFKHLLPNKVQPRFIAHGTEFFYKAPSFIKFKTKQLQDILEIVQTNAFIVSDKDQTYDDEVDADGKPYKTGIIIPKLVKVARIRLGNSVYKFGIGGLHSQEHAKSHYSIPQRWMITDHDVASYYPSLILMLKMFPPQIGEMFLQIYLSIYNERIDAKHKASECKNAGDKAGEAHYKAIADGLKIVLNGVFGKLGSKYSIFFSPEQMITTTITGQLALLMLIEMLEESCVEVVSANTDGIVLKTIDGMQWLRDKVIAEWESVTQLVTEKTEYRSIHSRDVNNYIAFKYDGDHKAKGVFGEPGIHATSNNTKIPARSICSDAVIAYLRDGTPIQRTIRQCKDVTRFLTVRNVKGGAVKYKLSPMQQAMRGTQFEPFELKPEIEEYLGKVVRYYYGKGELFAINYKTNGNQVASSNGAIPMMELLDHVPADVDYDRYETEAYELLKDVGIIA